GTPAGLSEVRPSAHRAACRVYGGRRRRWNEESTATRVLQGRGHSRRKIRHDRCTKQARSLGACDVRAPAEQEWPPAVMLGRAAGYAPECDLAGSAWTNDTYRSADLRY